jgi:hypothetical protein
MSRSVCPLTLPCHDHWQPMDAWETDPEWSWCKYVPRMATPWFANDLAVEAVTMRGQ